MKYLVKKIKDGGVVTGYEIKQRTSARHRPRGDRYILIDAPKYDNPKIEMVDGEVTIVEDVDKGTKAELYKQMDSNIRLEAAKKMNTNKTDAQFAGMISALLRLVASDRYTGLGLIATETIGSFSAGEELDTEEKIKEFYKEMLVDMDIKRHMEIIKYLESLNNMV